MCQKYGRGVLGKYGEEVKTNEKMAFGFYPH